MGQYQRELEDRVERLEKMVKEAVDYYTNGRELSQAEASMQDLEGDFSRYREDYPEEDR